MTYLTGLGSVLAIIAIVIVAGVIIAFLGKIIINAFDADRKLDSKKEDEEITNIRDNVYSAQNTQQNVNTNTYNYNQSSEATKPAQNNDFDADEDYSYAKDVDSAVARQEKEALEKEIAGDEEDDFFADYKKSISKPDEEDDDDLDLMGMIDEISNDVLDEKKSEIDAKAEEESKKNSSMLDKYSIDNILNSDDEDEEDVEEPVQEENNTESDSVAEMRNIRDDIMRMLEEMRSAKQEPVAPAQEETELAVVDANIDNIDNKIEEEVAKRVDEKIEQNLGVIEELKRALEEKEAEIASEKESKKALEQQYDNINKKLVEQFNIQNREIENQIQSSMTASIDQINNLKAELASLTKQLEEERSMNWKVAETNQHKSVAEAEVKPIETIADAKSSDKIEENSDVVEKIIDVEPSEDIAEDTTLDEEMQQIASEEVEAQVEERLEESNEVIKELTERIEMLTTELKSDEVVTFQFTTESQYQARIAVLEERLRQAKKDLKLNDKEYKPLEKVKKTLDRDKAKLRRKEAIAAKKKVALYGVNNYVDIDKEKAEKLAHELELLDGLRLSVSHCEDVMNANTERYPILEHTHNILVNNIKDLETDLMQLNKELKALKDGNNGNN